MNTWNCMQLSGLYMSRLLTLRVRCWLHARLEPPAILFEVVVVVVVFSVVGHAERGHTAVKRLVYHCQGAPTYSSSVITKGQPPYTRHVASIFVMLAMF